MTKRYTVARQETNWGAIILSILVMVLLVGALLWGIQEVWSEVIENF